MKRYFFLLIITIVLAGCPTNNGNGNGNGNPETKTVSGTIYDSYSTEPVAGVTVSFGGTSTTTDGNGVFSLTITQTPEDGTLKGDFLMYDDGYQFIYIEEILIDVDTTYDLNIPITPQSTIGYTTKEVTGDIFHSDGTTEIIMLSALDIDILNGNGSHNASDLYIDSYSINTPVFGDDCLLSGFAEIGADSFMFMEPDTDLSGASPITLDITEPAPGTIDTISITFNTIGNTAYGMYSSPYGFVPIVGRYLYDAGLGEDVRITKGLTCDQTSEDVDIYNPQDWQAYWRQEELDDDFNLEYTGHEKRYVRSGSIGNITSTVSLPAIDTSLGPDEPANPDSLSFSGDDLAQDAVAGADIFYYTASDDATGNPLGTIISSGQSITLPDEVQSVFQGISVRFNFTVRGYDTPGYELDFLEDTQLIPPATKYGEVKGSGAEYEKVIDF